MNKLLLIASIMCLPFATATGGEMGIGEDGDSDAVADPVVAEPADTLLEQFLEWLSQDNG